MRRDAEDPSRGAGCINSYFENRVVEYLRELFEDNRFHKVALERRGTGNLPSDEKMYWFYVADMCRRSCQFSIKLFCSEWCTDCRWNLVDWASEHAAFRLRLTHCQGLTRLQAAHTVDVTEPIRDMIWEVLLITAPLQHCSHVPFRQCVLKAQQILFELFDEDNEHKSGRLIPAFTELLISIFTSPREQRRNIAGDVVWWRLADDGDVRYLLRYLTTAASFERIRYVSQATDSTDGSNEGTRRRSREHSDEGTHKRYLPRLLEDPCLRQLLEDEASRGNDGAKGLLDELLSQEIHDGGA